MPKDRNIRIIGKRREFEVGRFVLAIMAQAEADAKAQATALTEEETSGDSQESKSPDDEAAA